MRVVVSYLDTGDAARWAIDARSELTGERWIVQAPSLYEAVWELAEAVAEGMP